MNGRPKRWTLRYGFQVWGKWRNPKKEAKLILLALIPFFLIMLVLFSIYLKSLFRASCVTVPVIIFMVALLGREALRKESCRLGIPIEGRGKKKELNERTFDKAHQAISDVLDQMGLQYDCSREYLLATFQLLEWDLAVCLKPFTQSLMNPVDVIDFKPSAVPPRWIQNYVLTLVPITEKNRLFVAELQEKLLDELVRTGLIVLPGPIY